MTLTSPPTTLGRPRDASRDAAILGAALRLLSRDGFTRMSMDAVAQEAACSKRTIYLRYASKTDLVTAAITQLRIEAPPLTDDLRSDLAARLRHHHDAIMRTSGMALTGTCLVEEEHTPELLALLRQRLAQPRRQMLCDAFMHARAHGRLAAHVNIDAAADLLYGAFFGRYLADQPFPDGWELPLIDTVLGGLDPHPIADDDS